MLPPSELEVAANITGTETSNGNPNDVELVDDGEGEGENLDDLGTVIDVPDSKADEFYEKLNIPQYVLYTHNVQ